MSDPAAGGDGGLPAHWSAPADARELDADLAALRRERAAAHPSGHGGPASRSWWRRFGSPGLAALLVLLGVAAVAGVLMVAAPVGLPTGSAARPLSSASGLPGTTGALLPAVTLQVGAQDRPARELRPAVLAVLPADCVCTAGLRDVAEEAGQYALPVVLITAAGNPEIPALLAAARATRAYPAVDPTAGLARTYLARGLTVLLVRADGIVTAIERQLRPGHRFGAALSELNA
jgi:hypothetical protein